MFFRRIADVRSVGYTECFMLLREDVLAATRDYPEAQVNSDEFNYINHCTFTGPLGRIV